MCEIFVLFGYVGLVRRNCQYVFLQKIYKSCVKNWIVDKIMCTFD